MSPKGDFWISADANFIDMAVIEWCKLFGDNNARHGWKKIVANPDLFQEKLLVEVNLDICKWHDFIVTMRNYRDKFLAHLDSDLVMNVPELDKALRAAQFYYLYILDHEFHSFSRAGIHATLDEFYAERLTEAVRVYRAAFSVP